MVIEVELAIPLASPCSVLLHLTLLPGYGSFSFPGSFTPVGGAPFYFQLQRSSLALVVSLYSAHTLAVFSKYSLLELLFSFQGAMTGTEAELGFEPKDSKITSLPVVSQRSLQIAPSRHHVCLWHRP